MASSVALLLLLAPSSALAQGSPTGTPQSAAQSAAPEKRATFLPERKTVLDQLRNPNYFGELDAKPRTYGRPNHGQALQKLRSVGPAFYSGEVGRAMAARFINRRRRKDGDFRYAYGSTAFKGFIRADQMLNAIPTGELGHKLDLNLLKQVNALAYNPKADSPMERVGHAVRRLAGRSYKPGKLRTFTVRSTPQRGTTAEQIAAVKGHGCQWKTMFGRGVAVYPKAKQVKPALDKLLGETRAALKDPNADIVTVAAGFAQKFVALHPFAGGNGRTARLLMDRILAERGLPPPILKDVNQDIYLSKEAYAKEVSAGVDRMSAFLSHSNNATRSAPAYAAQLFQVRKASLPDLRGGHTNLVTINHRPFALGQDGFVYNMVGRPHLLDSKGTLRPLSMMTYYLAIRRVAQAKDPDAALKQLTKRTRDGFERWSASADQSKQVKLGSDMRAIKADNRYRVRLPRRGNQQLIKLFDPDAADPKLLFEKPNSSTKSPSFVMSRYVQLDQEMYHFERGLKRSGDRAGARQLRRYRERLFVLAKGELAASADKEQASSKNPMGFSKRYEKLMFDNSPLRYGSFRKAQRRYRSKIDVWRGDLALVPRIGIHPDNTPFRPDAVDLARMRGKHDSTTNVIQELWGVGGKSGGTGYNCYTSDLALLARDGGFADKHNRLELNLDGLSPQKRKLAERLVQPGKTTRVDKLRRLVSLFARGGKRKPAVADALDISGLTPSSVKTAVEDSLRYARLPQEAKDKIQQRITQRAERSKLDRSGRIRRGWGRRRKASLVHVGDLLPEDKRGDLLKKLRDGMANGRDVLRLERSEKQPNKVSLTAYRRAFRIRAKRKTMLPGIWTQGGTFLNEQELTGIRAIWPQRVKRTYSQEYLDSDLAPKTAVPKPAAPKAGASNPPPAATPTPPVGPTLGSTLVPPPTPGAAPAPATSGNQG